MKLPGFGSDEGSEADDLLTDLSTISLPMGVVTETETAVSNPPSQVAPTPTYPRLRGPLPRCRAFRRRLIKRRSRPRRCFDGQKPVPVR